MSLFFFPVAKTGLRNTAHNKQTHTHTDIVWNLCVLNVVITHTTLLSHYLTYRYEREIFFYFYFYFYFLFVADLQKMKGSHIQLQNDMEDETGVDADDEYPFAPSRTMFQGEFWKKEMVPF